MKNAILHISDLHFVANYELKGNSKYDDSYKLRFISGLENGLSKNSLKLKYILISGDIANEGEEREYNEVLIFLNELKQKFNIKKENILICPGNHDITWSALRKTLDGMPEANRKEAYLYHDIKFQSFKKFYHDFFETKKDFICDSAIVDTIIDDEDKLIILGINSCFKESFQKKDHIGFIETKSLENKIKDIFSNIKFNDYDKLLVMHHNPEDFKNESANVKNWEDVSLILNSNFPTTFCGHIHSSRSKGEIKTAGNKYYVSVSSFCKIGKSIKNAFNIIHSIENQKHKYKVLFYEYEEPDSKNPYWLHHNSSEELDEVTLCIKHSDEVLNDLVLNQDKNDFTTLSNNENYKDLIPESISKLENNQYEEYVDMLMRLIQENKLFKTGHFHWSKSFRSHGIIDINYLISNKESINLISHLFYLKFLQVFIDIKPDLIIGIGIEGNVLGARLSILFPECDYSFIPDYLKDNDFSNFEHTIKEGKYKNIVLIKDLLFKADSLKDTIKKEMFNNKNIFVFSLFYCGGENESEIFSSYNNVTHHSICNKIKINLCQHNDNIENCTIIKHSLDLFYPLFSTDEK
ncbi:MAG: hypothetical protein CVU05_01315 [Bacteroidetes bacterium HGW-Bacteroidetes-21]|jgi:predicted MPP superfamily phosphohydrolase|nr:MAG: hypothetical protein CVU05_01315 [Bacteroidetes bacterium HGW-Bacteroidetes-21]